MTQSSHDSPSLNRSTRSARTQIATKPGLAAHPDERTRAPNLSTRLTWTSVIGFLAAVAFNLVFAYWAMVTVDNQSMERESRFAASGLRAIFDRVPTEQESSALWDDAVLRVRENDQFWMSENLTEWMGDYFGFDRVYVLDPLNRPIQAMRDSEVLSPDTYAEDAPLVAPLVEKFRGVMAAASAGMSDSSAAVGELGEKDIVLQDGIPAIVSVKPIVATTGTVAVAPGTEYLHVAFRRIDDDVLAEIADKYDLADILLLPPDATQRRSQTSVPVTNAAGQVLGYIAWTGDKPGTRMVLAVAPGLMASIVISGLVMGWLLIRLRRASAQLRASEAQAQFLAFHDTLTGLPNRALFIDRLDRALIAARRSGKGVALHSIDIDRFKSINDTRGHPVGDELIRVVGARLSSVLREADTVARLGGDEFAVVQTDVNGLGDAELTARRMLAAVQEPCDILGEKVQVNASIGAAVSAGNETSRDEMLRRADIALYQAKANGRGRFELFAGDMDEVVRHRRMIEDDLRAALEQGTQLTLDYQPLFASDGKTVLGAEALVRWNHPVLGRLSPEMFIAIAEERALIEPLGEFVLREAASFALRSDLPWIAVNVSPIQFRNEHFASKVLAILQRVGLPPNRLQLEITEGVLLENARLIEKTLAQLRSAGIRIVLDDFGTGYSSMSYLRRYAIDKLKIDKSFVAELGTSADADAIVRAMINLARSLRLEVTAEGVETAVQRDHLVSIGCQEMQGFLLSRPVGEDEIMAILGRAAKLAEKPGAPVTEARPRTADPTA